MKKMNLGAIDTSKENVITLYHGSPNKVVTPTYGLGRDTHDYGKGFYMTPELELAKEWAVSSSHGRDGWVHMFTLDLDKVEVFNFDTAGKLSHLIWVTEIARHRAVNGDERFMQFYEVYRDFLEAKFAVDTSAYDVLCGWRADDAYISIVDSFLANALSVPSLRDVLVLGDLGLQYCCKSQKSFEVLTRVDGVVHVPFKEYFDRYQTRVQTGRQKFWEIMKSPENMSKKSIRLSDLWRNSK